MDYHRGRDFERHVDDLMLLADVLKARGGVQSIQTQTSFTGSGAGFASPVFPELENRDREIGILFHEDAHLVRKAETLPRPVRTAGMNKEIELIRATGIGGAMGHRSGHCDRIGREQ